MGTLAEQNRTWAEVELSCIQHNCRLARKAAGGKEAMPVIKADAYGHGAVMVAKALLEDGARRFAVATPDEALQLRQAGIEVPVLLLGAPPEGRVRELQQAGITLCVPTLEAGEAMARAAGGAPLKVHIKLDTGMSRLGLRQDAAVEQALAVARLPGLEVEGIFTHFSVADTPEEDAFTKGQYAAYGAVVKALAEKGLHIPLHHCANSAAILYHPATHEDLVRPGIMLYGYNPNAADDSFDLRPALAWRAAISQVKDVQAEDSVGYGRAWKAGEKRRVATVPVGYADGLHRNLSGKGMVMLVRGQKAPLLGRICMDMCMLDVTDIPGVQAGDTATLIGRDGGAELTADDMGALLGTISYEVLCAVGKRVPRYYFKEGVLQEGPALWGGF